MRIATICLSAYWVAIFVATHLPKASLPSMSWSDKTYHLLAFSGLSFLLAWAIPGRVTLKHVTLVAGIGIGYACLDEFTQKFIPGRTSDFWDVVADSCGVGIGIVVYLGLRFVLTRFELGRRLILGMSK